MKHVKVHLGSDMFIGKGIQENFDIFGGHVYNA